MAPRPAPDLEQRRTQIVRAASALAESEGWPAVTIRRLAADLDATQPVVYTAFASRQSIVDAVAEAGFVALTEELRAEGPRLLPRMWAYLAFARREPRVYEAMFAMTTGLRFASDTSPDALHAAFAALREVVPEQEDTMTEVVWAGLHGLAVLEAAGRLRPAASAERVRMLHGLLPEPRVSP